MSQFYAGANNVPFQELPQVVVKAPENAVPGIFFFKAERMERAGGVVCELKGYADAQEYELKIDQVGKVIKVEKDND